MSENLKRAESLFNRIMNQGKDDKDNILTSNQSHQPHQTNHYRGHNSHNHHHHNHNHNSHNTGYHNNNHNNHNNNNNYNNGNHNNNHNGHNGHFKRHQRDLTNHPALKLPSQIVSELPSQHILTHCWTIWRHSRSNQENYLQLTQAIDFPKFNNPQETTQYMASLEQMWMNLSLLKAPTDVIIDTEYLIFKSGINPVWEDPLNNKGGRWIFKFSKNANDDNVRINLIWERLILKILTGSIINNPEYNEEIIQYLLDDINGIVLSIRKDVDIISLWNSNLGKSKRIQSRRVLCDSILKIIKECDLILNGENIDCSIENSERVKGVSFEYRLHSNYKK